MRDLLERLGLGLSEDREDQFVSAFFRRHPKLRRYAPKRVIGGGSGASGSHPEARQRGDRIVLFDKFWKLPSKTMDFVFAHEIGHYRLQERGGVSRMMKLAKDIGIDLWDVDSLPFGQLNMEEAFADSFASYHLSKQELVKRYPKWVSLIEKVG